MLAIPCFRIKSRSIEVKASFILTYDRIWSNKILKMFLSRSSIEMPILDRLDERVRIAYLNIWKTPTDYKIEEERGMITLDLHQKPAQSLYLSVTNKHLFLE
jgi:hypothetical protein